MKKHILVFSQYFYPEQFRINDICQEWVNRGYKVTVVTGIPNYPEGKYFHGYGLFKKRCEKYKGINIVRLPLIPRGRSVFGLVANYFSFVISGLFWKLYTNIKADVVFTYEVSPMTQALPAVWYAKKLHIPHFIYVMDLWPENVEVLTGIRNKWALNRLGKMVDYIYFNSSKIFTSSKSFIKNIEARGVDEGKLVYWPQYAEDFYHPTECKTQVFDQSKINITFAGNIGQAQGLDILIDATVKLKEQGISNLIFNIIGDGRYKATLQSLVLENKVSDYFRFIEKQPAEKIPLFFAESDVSLITLSQNKIFEKTIPAKLQSSMACGMPLLVSADGEVQNIIRKANCGFYNNTGDVSSLVNNLKKISSLTKEELLILAKNSLNYYKEHFNKEKLLTEMDRYLEDANVYE